MIGGSGTDQQMLLQSLFTLTVSPETVVCAHSPSVVCSRRLLLGGLLGVAHRSGSPTV